jgi:hypothetical protein
VPQSKVETQSEELLPRTANRALHQAIQELDIPNADSLAWSIFHVRMSDLRELMAQANDTRFDAVVEVLMKG